MYFEIYIDQFFAEQLLYGYLLLYLAMLAQREKKTVWRILAADVVFAFFQCVYIFTGNRWMSAAGLFLGAAAVSERGRRIQGIFFLFFITLCFGGTVQALLSLLPLSVTAGGLAAFFLFSFLRERFETCRRMREQEISVLLFWEDRSMSFRALVDTGNRLREPLTHKPVSILDARSADELLGDGWEQRKGFFLIPYHSIGREHGWMRAVVLDKMYVNTSDRNSEVERPLFAISNERVSLKNTYQVILNPEHIKI